MLSLRVNIQNRIPNVFIHEGLIKGCTSERGDLPYEIVEDSSGLT